MAVSEGEGGSPPPGAKAADGDEGVLDDSAVDAALTEIAELTDPDAPAAEPVTGTIATEAATPDEDADPGETEAPTEPVSEPEAAEPAAAPIEDLPGLLDELTAVTDEPEPEPPPTAAEPPGSSEDGDPAGASVAPTPGWRRWRLHREQDFADGSDGEGWGTPLTESSEPLDEWLARTDPDAEGFDEADGTIAEAAGPAEPDDAALVTPARPWWTRRTVVVGAAVAVLVGLGAVVAIAGSGTDHGRPLPRLGPIRVADTVDLADPFVLRTGGTGASAAFALYGSAHAPDHVPIATSATLGGWTRAGDALPALPTWADPDAGASLTRAPAAVVTPRGYLLYVTVREAASNRLCIAVTGATTPDGPFRDVRGAPLVCQRELGGSVDPSVARDGKGGLHLVWKSDSASFGQPSALWEQDLEPGGLGLTGEAHRLLVASRPWQGGNIESPALAPASRGGWWLFYSGNRPDTPAYATGLAWCPGLAGPCQETSRRPFLASAGLTSPQSSPGGLDLVRDADDRLWVAFSVWNRPPAPDGRFTCCHALATAPLLSL